MDAGAIILPHPSYPDHFELIVLSVFSNFSTAWRCFMAGI